MTLPPISFNYLGQFDSHDNYWQVINEASGVGMPFEDKDPNIININGAVIVGELSFSVVSHLSDEATKSFIAEFEKYLNDIVVYCCGQVEHDQRIYTASDFKDYIPCEVLNENLDQVPIFIFPPGEGGAEAYYDNLIPQLKGEKVVLFNNILNYLFSSLGEQYIEDLSFESLASDYILRLKKIQPEGPYYLAGWSFGGVLAFEVARQLVEQGEGISKLVMIDSFFNKKLFKENHSVRDSRNDINDKYQPSDVSLLADSVVLFKATKFDDGGGKVELFSYYTTETKANHIETVLNDPVEVIEIEATHFDWVKSENINKTIAQKIKKTNQGS